MIIKLPNGLMDGPDLFDYAEIDELRGKQQNYLANRELVEGNIGHLPKILEDMLLALQTKEGIKWKGKIPEAIWKLPRGDLDTILIKVREKTYGPRFFHQAQCTHCGHIMKNLKLDLDKLELTELSHTDMIKPKVIKLKDKTEIELKPLYLQDLFEALKISKNKQDKIITATLATSIKRIGKKDKITSADVENMSVRDMMYLDEKVKKLKLEGTIDTELFIDCSNCSEEFTMDLNVYDPNFFFPSKGSTT